MFTVPPRLPLLLATRIKDLSPLDVVIYSTIGLFLISFAQYYRKRSQGVGISVVENRKVYIKNHPELSNEIRRAIENGELIAGMTESEVTASVGHPKRVQLLRTSPSRSEVWIYRNGLYAGMENGILQKWDVRKKLVSIR